MIKDYKYLQEFNNNFLTAEKNRLTYTEAMKIFAGLYQEAVNLGVWHPENYEEGIKKNIEIARVLNWRKNV